MNNHLRLFFVCFHPKAFKEIFEVLDQGNNGVLMEEELNIGLELMGVQIPEEELGVLMEEVDPNNEVKDELNFLS